MPWKGNTLRIARVSEIGRCYIITTVTMGRLPVFQDWRLGRRVVNELKAQQDQGRARSIAWVVMPDHLHWLVELQSGSIETVVRQVKGRSALAVNKAIGRSGPIWQRGFHDHALRRDEDLRQVARYILRNPLEAGLVARIGDYPLWDACWIGD
ncbi:transposase [Pseudomonas sp. HR96]|uniref:REP-associated tyrosine transposase n=1 Tax=Pseudomonas sp. HR96 TaxID=1027966 RepID=UPI002A75797A|nr:transposase [Pseudomonas sp. HR96]WPP01329.1 transposase [Pseudomonas sp. HR96]